jgi:hypothetical protein
MPSVRMIAAVAALVCSASPAFAQSWPTRPVTMVVSFAAGSGDDVLGRIIAARLSEVLGQQVIVENVGGAGGMNGVNRVAKAAPDGYQFVLGGTGTFAANQTLYKAPLYNAGTDFTPVALIAETPMLLIAHKNLPVSNLQEFITYAKANQSKMQYGSGAWFSNSSGVRAVERGNWSQRDPCSLSVGCDSDPGSDCRAPRLCVPHHFDRQRSDRRRASERTSKSIEKPRTDPAGIAYRERAEPYRV